MSTRGNLIIDTADTRIDLGGFPRAVIANGPNGLTIAGTKGDDGVKVSTRDGRKDGTVTLGVAAMEALGGMTGPVRFELTLDRNGENGGKVYRVVRAKSYQTPHAVIRARK